LEYLSMNGYAVVASVANAEQIAKAKDNFWNFNEEKRPKLKSNNIGTWSGTNWLPSVNNGILGQYEFNHSNFLWETRLLPNVRETFSAIWGSGDLIVSFDGGNAFRPWKYDPSWATDGGWWHVDQNSFNRPHRQGKVCVQGLVTYYDATPETGGLCVVPKSHLSHDSLCMRTRAAKCGMDYFEIDLDDSLMQNGGVLVEAKAGDLLLWDSRTIHCNTPALNLEEYFSNNPFNPDDPARKKTNWDIIRLVGYVCMLPFTCANAEVVEQRKHAFIHHVGTSHWPTIPIIFNNLSPHPRDITTCSKEMLSLVGYR